MKYIDVSYAQKDIDWEKVKGNVDGVILRAGYGKGNIDAYFRKNAAECNRLGIPIGAYWFSYAYTVDMAKREAEYMLKAVEPFRMELPLAYDFEYASAEYAEKCGFRVSKLLATSMVFAFCEAIEAGGYWALNYANPDYLSRYYDSSTTQRFGLWLASWPTGKINVDRPPRECAIWQWGSSKVPGINGDVDTNEAYTDFAAVIKQAGINHLTPERETESQSGEKAPVWYTVKLPKAAAEEIAAKYGGKIERCEDEN